MIGGLPYSSQLEVYLAREGYSMSGVTTVTPEPRRPPREVLKELIGKAEADGVRLVVFHRTDGSGELGPEEETVGRYSAVAVVRNSYLAMVVYERRGESTR
jgi:hypothetical protein